MTVPTRQKDGTNFFQISVSQAVGLGSPDSGILRQNLSILETIRAAEFIQDETHTSFHDPSLPQAFALFSPDGGAADRGQAVHPVRSLAFTSAP